MHKRSTEQLYIFTPNQLFCYFYWHTFSGMESVPDTDCIQTWIAHMSSKAQCVWNMRANHLDLTYPASFIELICSIWFGVRESEMVLQMQSCIRHTEVNVSGMFLW